MGTLRITRCTRRILEVAARKELSMSNTNIPDQAGDDKPDLGTDGTIPNSDDGIAVGHDPEKSNFNPEEDETSTTES
jgi:hypothetical protein